MNLEPSIIEEGLEIFSAMKAEKESFFNKNVWLGHMMNWVMKDPSFKIDLFRFVDVLPVLTTSEQISKHVQEYLLKKEHNTSLLMNTALKATSFSLAKGIAASTIKKNVIDLAQRFIAGVNIKDAENSLKKLAHQGFLFTLDLLGEKTLSDKEGDDYQERYQHLIVSLPLMFNSFNHSSGELPNISIKVSALSGNLREEALKSSVEELKKRVVPLVNLAKQHGVFLNFDVESFNTHPLIYELFHEISLLSEFKSWPHLGIVVQAYLKESMAHAKSLIELGKKRKSPITIRLVKGAYWDYEVVNAKKHGHDPKVFLLKEETDLSYEQISRLLLDNIAFVRPAFGSHNIRSLAQAIAYAKYRKIDKNLYEIQMLYGMAESERRALLERGHCVRIYVPIGEMLPGMSYLVRRLLENTSQMGFLKLSYHDHKDPRVLLKAPIVSVETQHKEENKYFNNAANMDFTKSNTREQFTSALTQVRSSLPFNIPLVINGDVIKSNDTIKRPCPSDVSLLFSECSFAQINDAEKAIDACMVANTALRSLTFAKRAEHLYQLANILEKDRYFLSAIICFEVGKTWAEADADVIEAIDFCRYYAKLAEDDLLPKKIGHIEGEHNVISYQGRGPTVIIAPWNFPLSILCGMSVASYVCGNPIIMKPAEQSIVTAYMLYERMIKAAFLKTAIQFLPGIGEKIGPYLVSHKNIANICFTGSMKVGHEIMKLANTVVPLQTQMKRVVCEMGGKNAIIIDDDADLDEAISGVIASAFIYAGQKCSAASRVIVIKTIKEQFIERLIEAIKSIRVGVAMDPFTFMGPVVDEEAFLRLNKVSKNLQNDTLVIVHYVGNPIQGGYFIPPMIVEVNDVEHWIMQDELFGPILAIYGTETLTEAITIANNTRYALTGALFSRSPKNIAYASANFEVGNLYINQKCTGAIVGRQPFGGFKMSGTGIKAGGPHYLLNLVDTKVISENTMRRGFTPEISI